MKMRSNLLLKPHWRKLANNSRPPTRGLSPVEIGLCARVANFTRRKGFARFFMVIPFFQPRRYIGAAWLILAAMLLILASPWPAQPITAQSGITTPATGAAVSGDVAIMGTAVI